VFSPLLIQHRIMFIVTYFIAVCIEQILVSAP